MTSGHTLEIVNSRVFPYPREMVFRAFSDPQQLAQWWGPEGFTNTFAAFDFQPDGEWLFTMHGPDGTDYPNHSRFTKIVVPECIVYQHLSEGHEYVMTMLYEDVAQGTRLTWQMLNSAEKEKWRDFISHANEQNFDRLEASLARHHR